ncbi:MAG: hypothetical protein WD208_10850 [Dehalococcoidia bacterium]
MRPGRTHIALVIAGALALALAACTPKGLSTPIASPVPDGNPAQASARSESDQRITPSPTVLAEDPELYGIDLMVDYIQSLGVTLELLAESDHGSHQVPFEYFSAGDGFVRIDEYPTEHFAEVAAASVNLADRDDHYRLGNLLVTHGGDDPAITRAMEVAGAELFAGGGHSTLASGPDGLADVLADRGFTVERLEGMAEFEAGIELFSRRSDVLIVNGEPLHLFDFSYRWSPISAAVRSVSDDGSLVEYRREEPVRIGWDEPHRFYQQDGWIALYIGSDDALLETLREVSGAPFAGERSDTSFPYTVDSFIEAMSHRGLEVMQGRGVIGRPPYLTSDSPSALLLMNGERVEVFLSLSAWDRPRPGRGHQGEWPGVPHIYTRENLGAVYVGENPDIINALEAELGWPTNGVAPPPQVRMGLFDDGEVTPAEVVEVSVYSTSPHRPGYMARITTEPGCGWFHHGHTVERDGAEVRIEVTDVKPPPTGENWGCAWIRRTHPIYVHLGHDFEPGVEYKVIVNGEVQETFTPASGEGS